MLDWEIEAGAPVAITFSDVIRLVTKKSPPTNDCRRSHFLMTVKTRLLSNWDTKTRKNLKYATFASGGLLRTVMVKYPKSRTFVIFSKKQIMGWALAFCHKKEVNLHLYVNERYRGRGLSKVLVESALKYYPKVRLAIHNRPTRKIFPKIAAAFPRRVETYNWWKVCKYYRELVGLKIWGLLNSPIYIMFPWTRTYKETTIHVICCI